MIRAKRNRIVEHEAHTQFVAPTPLQVRLVLWAGTLGTPCSLGWSRMFCQAMESVYAVVW